MQTMTVPHLASHSLVGISLSIVAALLMTSKLKVA